MNLNLKHLLMIVWMLLMSSSGFAQVTGTLTKVPYHTRNVNPNGYVEYLPPNYVSDGSQKYPVLYWLHGQGEIGDGSSVALNKVLNSQTQIANWLKTHTIDFIVLVPQDFSGTWDGTPNRLQRFVDWANVYYSNAIDLNQQHLAGLSMGGYGIRDFLAANSNTYKAFATFTLMSTNLNIINSMAQRVIDNNQYVWIHHGTTDPHPNRIDAVTTFHKNVYALDPTRSRLTAYDPLPHIAWDKVYNGSGRTFNQLTGAVGPATYYHWTMSDPDVDWYGWMKSHSKAPPAVIAPTTIALSNSAIPASNTTGATVGTLTADGTAPVTIQLVPGALDNANFTITNNVLKVSTQLDFIAKPSYSVQVDAINSAGFFRKTFSITTSDVAPATITLSNSAIPGSNTAGTVVGTLSANGTAPVTLSLVAGLGDNVNFTIVGSELRVATPLDFFTRSTYNAVVLASNLAGSKQVTFAITTSDVAPTFIALSNTGIPYNNTPGTIVGTLSSNGTAPVILSLVSGAGDNANFTIVGNELRVGIAINFTTKPAWSAVVEAKNAGGTFQQTFSIVAQASGLLTKVPYNTRSANPRGYVEYLPPNYVADGSVKYPVLYWLHGLNERGSGSITALDSCLKRQIGNWLKTHAVDFIVLIPQDFSGYWNGTPNRLQQFVDWANVYYSNSIDVNQQHLAGLGSGGYGIRDFIAANSNTYKAFATFTTMTTNLTSINSRAQQIIDNDQYFWIHGGTADVDPNKLTAVTPFHNLVYGLDPARSRATAYTGLMEIWDLIYSGNGRNTTQTTGGTYYNWTTADPDIDWFGWMKARSKASPTFSATTAAKTSFSLYPNPTAGNTLYVTTTSGTILFRNISLVNATTGITTKQFTNNACKAGTPLLLNLSDVPAGAYRIVIYRDGKSPETYSSWLIKN